MYTHFLCVLQRSFFKEDINLNAVLFSRFILCITKVFNQWSKINNIHIYQPDFLTTCGFDFQASNERFNENNNDNTSTKRTCPAITKYIHNIEIWNLFFSKIFNKSNCDLQCSWLYCSEIKIEPKLECWKLVSLSVLSVNIEGNFTTLKIDVLYNLKLADKTRTCSATICVAW